MKAWRWAPPAERAGVRHAGAMALALWCCAGAAVAADLPTPPLQELASAGLPLDASGILSRAALESAAANQALYLQTFINGIDSGLISPYRLIGGSLYGDAAELRQLGFNIDEATVGSGGLVELSGIPGLVYRLDTLRQVVEITVGADQLQPHQYDASSASLRPSVSPGAVLNYETYAQSARTTGLASDERSELYSGFFDLRAFAAAGTLIQTGLVRHADPEPLDFRPALRLDTTLFQSDIDRLSAWRAGDVISGGGLSWVTPVRLGGLQWQRNFRLQPNFVTFPLPTITGSSAVPSTVDVLVNNVQQYSRPVEPGPFVIDNMPVVTGQGELRVIVRDALGREQVTTLPFYASASLLRPGLVDYSLEAGYLRRDYAVESDHYDDRLAGLASMRTGLTDWFTLESHAEGTTDLFNGGVGGVFQLGLGGVLSTSVAGSSGGAADGEQWSAAYQWTSRRLGIAASTRRATAGYQTLASLDLIAPPTREVSQVTLSTSVSGGGMSVAYVAIRGGGVLADSGATPSGEPLETRIGTLSYSLALRGQWAAHGSLLREFSGEESLGASLGLAHFFGGRASASMAVQAREHQDATATMQVGQSLPGEGTGAGWRIQGASGTTDTAAVSAGYRYTTATLEAGASDNGDTATGFAALRGAVVGMDWCRPPLLTNAIHDSFALVDTSVPNVAVFHENRAVGRSNADGLLLIPTLTAQARNQIAIDARDLPLDAHVGAVREVAVPMDRSGVFVKFPIERTDSAVVVLHTAEGQPVPPGATATLNEGASFIVGYDGQAFLKGIGPLNWVDVEWGDGACRAQFEYRPVAGLQQLIGPVRCVEKKS